MNSFPRYLRFFRNFVKRSVRVIGLIGISCLYSIDIPVEFNASSRALNILSSAGLLQGEENEGAQKVLRAAALTYVAGAAASILQLLRLIVLFGGRGRDDD